MSSPDNRRSDLDNYLKAIFDSLTHAEVWEDDNPIKKMDIEWGQVIKDGLAYVSTKAI